MKRYSRNRFRLQLELLEERMTPSTVAFGDFNGDGFRDMAVANPTASVGNLAKAGTISIFYGSATGYNAQNKQTLTMNDAGDSNNPPRPAPSSAFPSRPGTSTAPSAPAAIAWIACWWASLLPPCRPMPTAACS